MVVVKIIIFPSQNGHFCWLSLTFKKNLLFSRDWSFCYKVLLNFLFSFVDYFRTRYAVEFISILPQYFFLFIETL